MGEHFTCHGCGRGMHIRYLKKRCTMPGDYCPACAATEACAACNELVNENEIEFKHDVKNYICTGCRNSYHLAAHYIPPVAGVSVKRAA